MSKSWSGSNVEDEELVEIKSGANYEKFEEGNGETQRRNGKDRSFETSINVESFATTFMISMGIGNMYTLSTLTPAIQSHAPEWGSNTNAHAISVLVAFCAVSGVVAGPKLEAFTPRKMGLLGTFLAVSGLFFCFIALKVKNVGLFIFSEGALLGNGYGLAYLIVLTNILRWNPNRKELGGGYFACVVGLGSIICSQFNFRVAEAAGVEYLYLIQSIITLVLWLPCYVRMYFPPIPSSSTTSLGIKPVTYSRSELLSFPEFWAFYVAYFAALAPGWGLVAVFTTFFADVCNDSHSEASVVTTIVLLVYSIGRLGWGATAKKLGCKTMYFLFLAGQCLVLGILPTIVEKSCGGTVTVISLLVSFFGGTKAVFGAFVHQTFRSGSANVAVGLLMTGFGFAGFISPTILIALRSYAIDHGYKTPDIYSLYFYCMCGLSFVGSLCVFRIRPITQPGIALPSKP